MPDFRVVVKEYPPDLAGPLRWYAEVRSGMRVHYVTRPCRTRKEAEAVAGSWVRAYRPESVRHVGDGRWEL